MMINCYDSSNVLTVLLVLLLSSAPFLTHASESQDQALTATAKVNERGILLEFYHATNGHAWNENDGWAENLPNFCDWHGIKCNDNANSVTSLSLSANFVVGRTPNSLWRLPSLTSLDVSYNPHLEVDFVGLSPLNNNSRSTTKLQHLYSQQTATTSVSGIAHARDSLQTLVLSENSFHVQFPSELLELTKLTSLHLSACHLQGTLPSQLSQLSQLHELNLYDNDLTGTLPRMVTLGHMRHLTLSKNKLHGTIPPTNHWVLLEQYSAFQNDFTGPLPSFANSPHFMKLLLHGNAFSGEFPSNFLQAALSGPNANAITIDLTHNQFNGTLPESMDRLASVEILWKLGDNKWSGIPPSLCDNVLWNKGSIEQFGCLGLLCPPGQYSPGFGYATDESPCQMCDSAKYYGATNCFDKDDRSALIELYIATRGESWDRNDGWTQGITSASIDNNNRNLDINHVCNWYGVQCWDNGDARDGRVRSVVLPNNNLQGIIPESIFAIQHLTVLDVSRNAVIVPFHNIERSQHIFSVNAASTKTKDYDGIENANASLKRLYVDQTPIHGKIPKEIMQLTTLQVLSMQECGLNKEVPYALFDNMIALEELYLNNNDLRGSIPDRWNTLKKLKVLALAKNQFTGPLPSTFDTAPSLISVSLTDQISEGGGLTGTLPSYAATRTLSKLMVGNNKLEGNLPKDLLSSMAATDIVVTIDLANNKLTGTIPGTYNHFKKLNIYLEGNRITEIDTHLCNLAVDWMDGAVGSLGCDAILCPAGTMGGRRKFSTVECHPCPEGSAMVGPSYLGQVSCGPDASNVNSEQGILEILYNRMGGPQWRSSGNWMSETDICFWFGIDCGEDGSIVSIQLGSNQLSGTFPTEIFKLPNLLHLKLHDNSFAMSFAGIEHASILRSLSLDNTGLQSLDGIGQARSLVELNLGHNNLQSLPEELSKLIHLQTLDISFNDIAGVVPSWLSGLVSLTLLIVSNNNLEGPMPDFASLTDLIYLDFSNNLLTGTVPPSLLKGLILPQDERVVVDLSYNQLEGTVPAELARLSLLSIQLQENRIVKIDPLLCSVPGVNDYDVFSFGCDGILCPVGTWNRLGRQSSEEMKCEPCNDSGKYMGSTHCGGHSVSSISHSWSLHISLGIVVGVIVSSMPLLY